MGKAVHGKWYAYEYSYAYHVRSRYWATKPPRTTAGSDRVKSRSLSTLSQAQRFHCYYARVI
eukprot:scaffold658466_cov64-Prasinocladus_malaysianus.AAC.1